MLEPKFVPHLVGMRTRAFLRILDCTLVLTQVLKSTEPLKLILYQN